MKRYLILLPLLAAQFAYAHWTVRLHKKLPEDQHMHLRTWGDHYFAIGSDKPLVQQPGTTNAYYHDDIAFVRKLDRNLNVLKEYRFPRTKFMTFFYAHPTPRYLYLTGESVDAEGWRTARLACMDHDLNLLWDKVYHMPGGVHGSPMGIDVMPDGDLMGSSNGDGRKGGRAFKGLFHFRLSPDGTLRWIKNHMKGRFSEYAMQDPVVLDDGNLLVAGYTFRSSDPNTYKGWDLRVWKINYATGDLMWEKTHVFPKAFAEEESMPGDPKIKAGVRLANGDIAYGGTYETMEDYVRQRNLVLVLGQDGEVRLARAWRNGDLADMEALVPCHDGLYRTVSTVRTHRVFSGTNQIWAEIHTFDAEANLLETDRIDIPGFGLDKRNWLFPGVQGDYVFASPYEVAILRLDAY